MTFLCRNKKEDRHCSYMPEAFSLTCQQDFRWNLNLMSLLELHPRQTNLNRRKQSMFAGTDVAAIYLTTIIKWFLVSNATSSSSQRGTYAKVTIKSFSFFLAASLFNVFALKGEYLGQDTAKKCKLMRCCTYSTNVQHSLYIAKQKVSWYM